MEANGNVLHALRQLGDRHERQLNGDGTRSNPGLVTEVAVHEDQISGREGLFAMYDRILSEVRHLRFAMYGVAVAVIGSALGVILYTPGGHP